MFKWIKSLFSSANPERKFQVEERPPAPAPTIPKKKKSEVDLESMKKDQLLEYAKKNKIKANASMKKADIIAAIRDEI